MASTPRASSGRDGGWRNLASHSVNHVFGLFACSRRSPSCLVPVSIDLSAKFQPDSPGCPTLYRPVLPSLEKSGSKFGSKVHAVFAALAHHARQLHRQFATCAEPGQRALTSILSAAEERSFPGSGQLSYSRAIVSVFKLVRTLMQLVAEIIQCLGAPLVTSLFGQPKAPSPLCAQMVGKVSHAPVTMPGAP
jgi:hypothetical protein